MVHDVGQTRIQHVQCHVQAAAEVRGQDFDTGMRRLFAHGANAVCKMLCAPIPQVIPVHTGDNHVFEFHGCNGLRQVPGLFAIRWQGFAVAYVAEGAAARTQITQDHESGRSMAKAFPQIGAGSFFAHGMKLVVAQHLFELRDFRTVGRFRPNPVRLFQRRLRHNLDRDARSFGFAFV